MKKSLKAGILEGLLCHMLKKNAIADFDMRQTIILQDSPGLKLLMIAAMAMTTKQCPLGCENTT